MSDRSLRLRYVEREMIGAGTTTTESAESAWRSQIYLIVILKMRRIEKMKVSYLLKQSFRPLRP